MGKMVRRKGIYLMLFVTLLVSCNNSNIHKNTRDASYESSKKNNSVFLKIEDAALVQDDVHPDSNTAEWSFRVNQPGRYEVWLSSITRDTMNMGFDSVVTITAGDSRIQKMPVGDNIVADASDIKAPWFKAESEMGSVFFSKPGEYSIQIISEKVKTPPADLPLDNKDKTVIKSLILKPVVY
jgi:hypothetical protein